MVIEAKYEDGVFRPLRKVKLKEEALVEIHIDGEDKPKRAPSIRDLGLPECGRTVRISTMASVTSTR
jgi:predicted DNA-binding antitoxin AbrB/MazE fold protein